MSQDNVTEFIDLIEKIRDNKILLPDFQRKFVWTDVDMQKGIIASVLSKLPIGSILLLEAKPTEYAAKVIGTKIRIDTTRIEGKVNFLLDGQQRITTLTNVFSNIVQENAGSVSNLVNQALKRRFFLKVPHWSPYLKENDIFGVKQLVFPLEHPSTDIPTFLSSDVKDCIVMYPFNANDDKPYNPKAKISNEIVNFCIMNEPSHYLYPLYLLSSRNGTIEYAMMARIIKNMSQKISESMIDYYTFVLTDPSEKRSFVTELANGANDIIDIDLLVNDPNEFKEVVTGRANTWQANFYNYLIGCLNTMQLNQVKVSEDKRDRAIDIYENMNRGGVSLSTFDLIMAKVSTVAPNVNYSDRIINDINKKRIYPESVVPMRIIPEFRAQNNYNASMFCEVYNSNDELNKTYIDVYLDVLSLICNVPDYNPDHYKIEYIKRPTILQLSASVIDANTSKVIDAMDRALFFLNVRCGLRKITDVNYALMLVVIAVIFANDNWFYNNDVHNKLEAWYWGCIFSGEFDSNQNDNMLRNLKELINYFNGKTSNLFVNLEKGIFNTEWFSNEDFVLMKYASDGRVPKMILRTKICQYLLAQTYHSLFDTNQKISVFYNRADELEAHHIVPLGGNLKELYKQKTNAIRKDKNNILNSPINFVYITKTDNLMIGSKNLTDYVKSIDTNSAFQCLIPTFQVTDQPDMILKNRFKTFSSSVLTNYRMLCGL